MIKLQGTEKKKVEIEVTIDDFIEGLETYLGMYDFLHAERDSYWCIHGDKLVRFIDVAYHGSPQYEVFTTITDKNTIEKFKLINRVIKDLRTLEMLNKSAG